MTDKHNEKIGTQSMNARLKKEILSRKFRSVKERFAFLAGIMRTSGTLGFVSGKEKTYSLTLSGADDMLDSADNIIFSLYRERGKKVKRGSYLYTGDLAKSLLSDCGILENRDGQMSFCVTVPKRLTETDNLSAAVIMGYFVGGGNFTAGESYNLTFTASYPEQCEDLRGILEKRDIKCGEVIHREKYTIYVTNKESMSSCLYMMGSRSVAFEFDDIVLNRSRRLYINRTNNCELNNMGRTINASVRVRNSISELMDKGAITDKKLRDTARARIDNPNATYDELAEILGISKSGVRHRLNKLDELANSYKETD